LFVFLYGAFSPYNNLFGDINIKLPNSVKKSIALTFDDGPHPVHTPQILDILDDFDIKGTFFLVGKKVEKLGSIANSIVDRGHSIGNHLFSHKSSVFKSGNFIKNELIKTQEIIKKHTNKTTNLLRPPYGFRSPLLFRIARQLGYTVVGWSNWAQDWKIEDPDEIRYRVIKDLKEGDIILLHDGAGKNIYGDRTGTVQALPLIIEDILKGGFNFIDLYSIKW
jgi:peptidoglycan/xylan/chitin deacetylase (PgdA/CDA1 family)